jgi:hypothetical protein
MAAIKPTAQQRARVLLHADLCGMGVSVRMSACMGACMRSAALDEFDRRVADSFAGEQIALRTWTGFASNRTREPHIEPSTQTPRTSTPCEHAPQTSLVHNVPNARLQFHRHHALPNQTIRAATCVFALCKFCDTGTLEAQALAHQNVLRYMDETILQRDNPVRKCPNWRNCFEASNVSSRTSVMHKKRHARAVQSNRLRGENTASGRVSWNRQTKIDRW